mmetsp:Transcript_27397/g.24280  ORF Transcript_27397/g.24280 Transcript_27397/m.24280 type:complete len:82 (+) Transcript_27397:637-882(+)
MVEEEDIERILSPLIHKGTSINKNEIISSRNNVRKSSTHTPIKITEDQRLNSEIGLISYKRGDDISEDEEFLNEDVEQLLK